MMSAEAHDTLWHVEANCKSECISWFYLALYKISWTHILVYAYFFIIYTQFSCSVMSDSLWLHGLRHTRLPCPSPAPGPCSNSCPLSQWCHPTISSSVVPFSSCLKSFLASESFLRSQFFASGGQSIGVSASTSVLSMNIQDWFLLDLLIVQGTLKSVIQHHSPKASILWHSVFFMLQVSHQYMTTGKTIALTIQTFVCKVVYLLLNILSRFATAFLPRSKSLLISWLQSPSAVFWSPRK